MHIKWLPGGIQYVDKHTITYTHTQTYTQDKYMQMESGLEDK